MKRSEAEDRALKEAGRRAKVAKKKRELERDREEYGKHLVDVEERGGGMLAPLTFEAWRQQREG